jgi:RHS repeat-associated protein
MFPSTGTWRFRPLDASPAAGKIDSVSDRNGNELHFVYDGAGQLAAVIDTLDRSITIGYNAGGFISSITDWTGRQVRYEYYQVGEVGGSFGDLKSVTTPAVTGTPNGNDFPDGKTTIYTYSTGFSDNRLNHNLLTITDPSGHTYLTNVYASTTDQQDLLYDRVVRQVWGDPGDIIDVVYVPQTPAPENNFAVIKAIMNDRVGNVKEFFYDAGNRGVIRREYTGRADPDQPTTETQNRPTNKLRPGDPDYFETRYEYNADSKLIRTLHPEGDVTLNVYEEDLDPDAPRRSRGNLREIHHQPGPRGGDQTEIIEYFEYDTGFGGCCGTNFVIRAVDGRGHETLHQYDTHGNRIRTTHRIPEIIEEWEYNAFGQTTAHILQDNGSAHRRRDTSDYYEAGPQRGYLQHQITDATGFALPTTFEYDAVGNAIRQIDPRGHDTQYVVNQLNQVVRETSREVTDGSGIRYQQDTYYDANDNIVRWDVLNVDETGTVGPNPYWTTTIEYEILNRPVRITQEVDEGRNVVTEYQYDANRNQTLVRYGEAVNGHQPANVVLTLYDERDLVFRVVAAPGDPLQSTTQFDYDRNGNRILIAAGLESEPRNTLNEYDGYDRLVRVTDAMGNVTTYHYDANANRVATRIDGELSDVAGGAGNVRMDESTTVFDALDRAIQTTVQHFDPETQAPIGDGVAVTQTFYSGTSQVVRIQNDNGHQRPIAYDTANRQSVLTDAAGNEVVYTYDANSNVIQRVSHEISDLGSPIQTFTTAYSYDNLDRLIQTLDSSGNVTQQAYDSRHNLTRSLDAADHATRSEYDGLSRLLRTIRDMNGNGPSADDPADIVTTQAWDDDSRLTSQGDDNGHVTTYSYDARNRSTQTTYADGTVQTVTFDVHDNVLSATDANGSVATNTYDLLDRRTSRSIVPGLGVSADTTSESYHHDGQSRLVYAQDDDSLVSRAYDSLSNLIRETLNGQITASVYDGVGNQMQCTYPGGRTINRAYDALERVQTVADGAGPTVATYAYVGPARVERRTLGNGTRMDYVYDGLSGVPNPPGDFGVQRLIRTTHSVVGSSALIDDRRYTWDRTDNKTQRKDVRVNGPRLTHDYAYDPVDRLIHTQVTGPTGGVLRDQVYDLDGVGNRTQVTGGSDPGLYTMDPTLPEPADFQVNQYTVMPSQERGYDRNGNLVAFGLPSSGDLNCDGALDESDIAPFVLALVDPLGYQAVYPFCDIRYADCNGDDSVNGLDVDALVRLLLGQWPELRFHISYDYRNQMIEFYDAQAGQRHLYGYDPLGRRTRKVIDADGVIGGPTETRYFYDGWRIVEEQDNTTPGPHTLATYVHGVYIDEVLSMRRDVDQNGTPEDYCFHADDLYNVMAVTDSAGNVIERYEYGDYGQPEFMNGSGIPISQSAIHSPYLFTGREYDPETGWYYYRTRYLEPVAGRFTTRDTIGIWGDAANLGNGYAYAANNPWSFVDPMGQQRPGDNDEEARKQLEKLAKDQREKYAKGLLKQRGIDIDKIAGDLQRWWDDLYIVDKGLIGAGVATAAVAVAANADEIGLQQVRLCFPSIPWGSLSLDLDIELGSGFTISKAGKAGYELDVGLTISLDPSKQNSLFIGVDYKQPPDAGEPQISANIKLGLRF